MPRSFSLSSAASFFLRTGGFLKGLLQNVEHRQIAWAPRGPLAAYDVVQRCHQYRNAVNFDNRGTIPHAFEGPDAVDRSHEIELKTVIVSHDAVQVRCRVIRAHHRRPERTRKRLQLADIPRRFAEEEIEIDRRDRCALQGRSGISNQHCLEIHLSQPSSDLDENRPGVHGVSIDAARKSAMVASGVAVAAESPITSRRFPTTLVLLLPQSTRYDSITKCRKWAAVVDQ
jgi:hypothetical protein